MKRNNFNRAIRHLKKDLTESPTNSTSRVYANNPAGFRLGKMDPERVFYPDIDGNFPTGIPGKAGDEIYKRPRGYWDEGPGTVAATDWDIKYDSDYTYEAQSENPRETETLIDPETGYVKSELPPGTRSFILGPIVDSYVHVHGYDNITRVGYIQKDTREFVLLGYVEGLWGDDDNGNPILQDGFGSASGWRVWDGQESSFTSVNSNFTFEHLQWFHNKLKSARYIANVSFFLSGGLGCVLGHGGPRQPPGSTQGNTPGGGGPPGSSPPNWPKNMGGDDPPPNAPPYGGPPNQSPPPNEGEPQQPPGTDDPPTPPYPKPPRKRRKPGEKGGEPGGDSDSTKTKTDSEEDWDTGGEEDDWDPGDQDGNTPPEDKDINPILKGLESLVKATPVGAIANAISKGFEQLAIGDYGGKIAQSMAKGEPLNIPQSQIPQRDINDMVNSIDRAFRDGGEYYTAIPVVPTPQPYSDDNFYEGPNRQIIPHTPQSLQQYPPNTIDMPDGGNMIPGRGLGRDRLAKAGQAQPQIVVPKDGSEPYLKYTDHAYINFGSKDAGEFPTPIHAGIANAMSGIHGPNAFTRHGYPPNIMGDVRKEVKVPYSKLPPNIQERIRQSGYVPPTDTPKPTKPGKIEKNATTKSDFMKKMSSDHVDRENAKRGFGESRIVSVEQRRKILREVKQPYVMPEIKKQKYKPNFKGKYKAQNTPDVTKSKQSDDMVRAKNAAGQTWRTKDKYWGGYESTERMNVISDRVGHGEIAFDMIVKANSKDFQKITERFKTNIKDRELQEHLNTLAHEKAMREMDASYVSPFRQKKVVQEQETIEADRDPLFAKVARKLKTEIDYSDKPSPNGFPEEPPPALDPVTGFHPEYGKQFARYTKLDPESADAMPSTGDPDIDATVASQKTSSLKTVRSVVKKKGKPNS